MRHLLVDQVRVSPFPGKKLEHNGIRVLLIGQIELAADRGHYYDFLSLGEYCKVHIWKR